MSSVDDGLDRESASTATDSTDVGLGGTGSLGDPGHDIRTMIEAEVRRLVPSLLGEPVKALEPLHGIENDEMRAIREELQATRLELQRIRAEKVSQDREVFLKEQLRSLGVRNIELALRAVRDDFEMSEEGKWVAALNGEKVVAHQYLRSFLSQNPELMPARAISGTGIPSRHGDLQEECDLDQIRPGMDPGAMRRAREAVVRIIAQSKRAL